MWKGVGGASAVRSLKFLAKREDAKPAEKRKERPGDGSSGFGVRGSELEIVGSFGF